MAISANKVKEAVCVAPRKLKQGGDFVNSMVEKGVDFVSGPTRMTPVYHGQVTHGVKNTVRGVKNTTRNTINRYRPCQ